MLERAQNDWKETKDGEPPILLLECQHRVRVAFPAMGEGVAAASSVSLIVFQLAEWGQQSYF